MLFSLSYLQVGQIPFVRGEDIPQIGTCIFWQNILKCDNDRRADEETQGPQAEQSGIFSVEILSRDSGQVLLIIPPL
jgi:hypothetical protein